MHTKADLQIFLVRFRRGVEKTCDVNAYGDGFADFLGEISTRSSDKSCDVNVYGDGFADFLGDILRAAQTNVRVSMHIKKDLQGFLARFQIRKIFVSKMRQHISCLCRWFCWRTCGESFIEKYQAHSTALKSDAKQRRNQASIISSQKLRMGSIRKKTKQKHLSKPQAGCRAQTVA